MEVKIGTRDDGWRRRGRPPRPVDPEIIQLLQTTYDNQSAAIVELDDEDTDEEVKELVAQLKRGAKDLDKRLKLQIDDDAVRFYIEDK